MSRALTVPSPHTKTIHTNAPPSMSRALTMPSPHTKTIHTNAPPSAPPPTSVSSNTRLLAAPPPCTKLSSARSDRRNARNDIPLIAAMKRRLRYWLAWRQCEREGRSEGGEGMQEW
eukprot:365645-Chlamydomonas_euryale.AAC.11